MEEDYCQKKACAFPVIYWLVDLQRFPEAEILILLYTERLDACLHCLISQIMPKQALAFDVNLHLYKAF